MEILTKAELRKRYPEIRGRIMKGALFIHPTDTIYGLGCHAFLPIAVATIRKLKHQYHQPFSIWAPSVEWIREHCRINADMKPWLEKLPGPYTLILPLKRDIPAEVNLGRATLGVRLPDHWFSKVVQELNVPIVTTSANKTGEPFMTSLENLDPNIEYSVEFMIYEGEKRAKPSVIVEEGKVKER